MPHPWNDVLLRNICIPNVIAAGFAADKGGVTEYVVNEFSVVLLFEVFDPCGTVGETVNHAIEDSFKVSYEGIFLSLFFVLVGCAVGKECIKEFPKLLELIPVVAVYDSVDLFAANADVKVTLDLVN